jgi:hypothetical protein
MDISQQTVFVFDKEGKYVSKLNKRGDGPDEYMHMTAIFVDDNEEYIELVNFRGSKTTKLKYTNISFELVEALPFSSFQYNSYKRDGDIYYFATQQLDNTINGKPTNAGLIVVDEQNNIKTLFDKNIETNHNYFSINMESFIKNNKNELFVSIMYDNSFYQLEASKARPVFTIDFGKYGINNAAIGLKSTEKQMDYLKNTKKLAAIPVLNINNDNIMSFSYYFKQDIDSKGWIYKKDDLRQYIKIKKDNKTYHVKKIRNDLTQFPDRIHIGSYYCSHETWYEGYLVDVVIPAYYFSDSETDKIFVDGIGEITADDNPIVIMMKLKENL